MVCKKRSRTLNHQIDKRLSVIGEYDELLEQVNLLRRSGLGLEELGQLQQMQSQITYSQELSAEDAVAQFFES